MATPEEQLEDFKKYLLSKGEKYENLTMQDKMSWSEVYDKYKATQSASQQASAVKQEEDPIIKGIYERLEDNKSEPGVNSFITFGPLTLLVRQEWIDLKNDVLAERKDKHHKTIFLRGTSGRGKSSFVYYLIYCILLKAKRSKKRKAEAGSENLVGYVKDGVNNAIVHSLLTLDGFKTVDSIPTSTYCYIADIKGDVPKTNLAQCFTMVVASDDAGKVEFGKRVDEALQSGYLYTMPPPTREQMHLMFEGILTGDEIDFRLDVVGCNPRKLGLSYKSWIPNPEFETVVAEACQEVLGINENSHPKHYQWVMGLVLHAIEAALVIDKKVSASSLFRECVIEEHGLTPRVYTSTFMCFLAGKIRDKFRDDTLHYLESIFGRSGVGNCHEYDSHNFFASLPSETHPCWSYTRQKWEKVHLGKGPRTKVIFRNIKDISGTITKTSNIPQRYLLPSITNLALIDSIILPDVVLQMTVSDKHRGATSKAGDISKQLKNPKRLVMIFVVPEAVLPKFKFPTDLPHYIEMYVTVAKTMTLTEARKLLK